MKRTAQLATTGVKSGAAVALQVGAFVAGSTQHYIFGNLSTAGLFHLSSY
ncbi:hypothetical protein [Baia soyae]|uniref:Uncharacterized protein n=1 Tax=Baia soyae TaxID=1544746 RepID=A0A4R2RK68_9BACL|nr:hypothetical protein [Baia soyae]TCP64282.1 hypothetical protein EDD57_14110 [Baia soyae]